MRKVVIHRKSVKHKIPISPVKKTTSLKPQRQRNIEIQPDGGIRSPNKMGRQRTVARNAAVSKRKILRKRAAARVKYVTVDPPPESIERIRLIQGRGRGRILIIVGNGPSILEAPLDQLQNKLIDTLSVNTPDQRIWPTTYWSFFDLSQMFRHEQLWNNYDGIVFNSTAIKRQNDKSMQFKSLRGIGWSDDLTKGLYIGRSSVYASMQIAKWMDYHKVFVFGCLPDGQKITTNKGMVPLESLSEDHLVYTGDGFRQWLTYQRRWYSGDIVTLATQASMIPLSVTAGHPIYALRGSPCFVEAQDLNTLDKCVFQIDRTVNNDSGDSDWWFVVGLYAATGYINSDGAVIISPFNFDDIDELYKTCEGVVGSRNIHKDFDRFVIEDNEFIDFVSTHVGGNHVTKYLSAWIMQLPHEQQIGFINGYIKSSFLSYASDGYGHNAIVFVADSESVADAIQKILLRYNIISTLHISHNTVGYDRTRDINHDGRYRVSVYADQLNRLAEICKINVDPSDIKQHAAYIDGDNLIVKLKWIESKAYAGYVNNIEVEGTHTYSSGLFTTHNCDMNQYGINGKLHFYGDNPDVKPSIRARRFKKEAEWYDYAADVLSESERNRFVFATTYNPWDFVNKFGVMNHRNIDGILDIAKSLSGE